MPVVYLPGAERLFLWGDEEQREHLGGTSASAEPTSATLLTPAGVREVPGRALPLLETVSHYVTLPADLLQELSASAATWILASKLGLELVAREQVVPTLVRRGGAIEARWAAALSAAEDAARVHALARSMPPAAHAVPVPRESELEVWSPDALLRAFLDALIDAFIRQSRGSPEFRTSNRSVAQRRRAAHAWPDRFREALEGERPAFETQGFAERSIVEELQRWSEPALGARDKLRACFRLELPKLDDAPFTLTFLLQSPDDPSLLVPAEDVWGSRATVERLGRAFRAPQETLLEALGRGARIHAALAPALEVATPASLPLEPAQAWQFLQEGAAALSDAGFGVFVPGELTARGQRRLRLRMRVGGNAKTAGTVGGVAGLGLDELLTVNWEAVIGDQALSVRELSLLARHKIPLVRFRGDWVAVDPGELREIQQRLGAPARFTVRDALQAALSGEVRVGTLAASVAVSGPFASALERLKDAASTQLPSPSTLRASLRPYQERGLNWLWTMASLGLGGCLADDMGLGKTIQLLAFLLRRAEAPARDTRPTLLVAPTSVVGNWEREAQRFAPSLPLVRHYGDARTREPDQLQSATGALVLTTYGILRRDLELLSSVPWAVVALDEAQNIKNAASSTASAARTLKADHRFALTGTPVENRLAELWSILQFANPGLLGPLQSFRSEFAVPIERYGSETAAERLRRIVGPFILRRVKSDPTIISELPPKQEMKVFCTLTREQATLYKAVVDEELRRVEQSSGIARKGRVLALLTATKQICNHPAQYLGESAPLANRSGKLDRLTEMLEEVIASREKALVFSQFREMGERLSAHLMERLGVSVVFLHGGTPRTKRDEMVRRFQDEPHGPRVFVLSLKAGGVGLNLTAATHVFHFDRWWNPAVEDQATDRAYRIGQKSVVQVHKLVCAGTMEEKIDSLLERKRALATKVVGSGEQWITELGADELRELFQLDRSMATADADDEESPSQTAPRRRRRGEVRA